ncbi:MAG TPA: DUF3293 domain-containing protein [Vibrio sp.]|uniref:DUF3293 domain-containing protein n=1 Tax=Vibrio TaxID=662 RepID=UPI00040628CB|nr:MULTISPECIES: DUF3293 domain-containing protein [Vibrio]HCH03208.1 DUF3293 domain-containing protein [Vibrio sp.]
MMKIDKELVEAYQQTCYRVEIDRQAFKLFIGQPNIQFSAYCQQNKIQQWAIITAYNPYSNPTAEPLNQQANIALSNELQALGYEFYRGDGMPDSSDWSIEKGFWIANIELITAKNLAIKYQQNAFVFGDSNGIPLLHLFGEVN